MMSLRLYILLLIILLAGSQAPRCAYAQGDLSGSILYGASHYRAEVDGKEAQLKKAQYSQVALRYEKDGVLGDYRAGRYTLMLGYEFNTLAPTISNQGIRNSEVDSIKAGKLLYNGALVIAPGGLPFRLTMYARDIHASSFTAGQSFTNTSAGLQGNGLGSLIESGVKTEINNGTHREVAATLLIGIRNGSYLGAYRDVLSQLPRLMIDYHQIDVKDIARDFNRQNYRERDLAFISLNKKDNWVHLRMHDYTDFLDSKNDRTSSQIMIGTVDHTLLRQWINLTNWIKISGDLSLTGEKIADETDASKTYHVNMFASVRRTQSKLDIFSNFERGVQGGRMTQEMALPIYGTFELNRDTLYRVRLQSNFTRESLLDGIVNVPGGTVYRGSNTLVNFSAALFRTRAIVFTPDLHLETYDNDGSNGLAEKINLEWSNRKGGQGLLWSAGVNVAGVQSLDGTTQASYREKGFYGKVEKNLNRTLRMGMQLSGSSGEGSGAARSGSGGSIQMESLQLEVTGTQLAAQEVNRFQRYSASAFLEHNGQRYSNRLEFGVDSISADTADISVYNVEHTLLKRAQDNEFKLTTVLLFGDRVAGSSTSLDYLTAKVDREGVDFSWYNNALYGYTPNRRIRFELNGSSSGSSGAAGSTSQSLHLTESLNYRFYTVNGIIRKLAELYEELGWERVSESDVGREKAYRLRLGGSVYPTKYFYAKMGSEFVMFEPNAATQWQFSGETGLNFPKVDVVLSYARGFKEQEGALPESKEERWDLKVKKIF